MKKAKREVSKETFFTLYLLAGVPASSKYFCVWLVKETSHFFIFLNPIKYGFLPAPTRIGRQCSLGSVYGEGPLVLSVGDATAARFSRPGLCGLLESIAPALSAWAWCWVFAESPKLEHQHLASLGMGPSPAPENLPLLHLSPLLHPVKQNTPFTALPPILDTVID